MFTSLKSFAVPQRGDALLLAAVGPTASVLIAPASAGRGDTPRSGHPLTWCAGSTATRSRRGCASGPA